MPLSCSALTSSVSCTMRSAWWSPHAVTQAAQPLHRSETKIEKMPPDPGFFFSGVAKIAFALWNAIGTLSMTLKNSSFACRREAVDRVRDLADERLRRRLVVLRDRLAHPLAGLLA